MGTIGVNSQIPKQEVAAAPANEVVAKKLPSWIGGVVTPSADGVVAKTPLLDRRGGNPFG